MKEFLSREGVSFITKNVDGDDAAYKELIGRGFRSIPVTIIGGEAVRGYDPAAIRAALDALSPRDR